LIIDINDHLTDTLDYDDDDILKNFGEEDGKLENDNDEI